MKEYSTLTRRGQRARLRRLAQSVLTEYPLVKPHITRMQRGYNTTFCIDAEDGPTTVEEGRYAANRYLLRLHRPGWYAAMAPSATVVQSELLWLSALRHETGLVVPEPMRTNDSAYTASAGGEGVPGERITSLLRWINGRCFTNSPKPIHFYYVGALAAQLHNHAAAWTLPAGFVRPHWSWEALFGAEINFTDLRAADLWGFIPSPHRQVLEQAALVLQPVFKALGSGPEVWGLIHADLHLDNVLFAGGEARPIDFDDCGFGYWLYDIAVALWELCLHPQWSAIRQAFFDGYARHRPIPKDQLPYLGTVMAAREAYIGLGIAATIYETPAYRVYLEEDMQRVAETVRAIQAANSGT